MFGQCEEIIIFGHGCALSMAEKKKKIKINEIFHFNN